MSKYVAYPAYKDSGVEWLGDVPQHWNMMAIKHALSIPITDGPHETPEILNSGVVFISAEAIKKDKIDFAKKRGYISYEDNERFSKKYKPQVGDIYMVKSGATTGNVARVDKNIEFNIWSPLAALRPDKNLAKTDFIFYFMKSKAFFSSVELGWSFGTQQNIGMGVIANLKIALPPVNEQQQIANFLDNKTTHLDKLIGQKQQMIGLLNEKRMALITQAVTKGLDLTVPMKDSGVEWLGDVPEHWEVIKLRFLLRENLSNGIFKKAVFWGTGCRIINVFDVYIDNDIIDESSLDRVECSQVEQQHYSATHGDFFFVRSSLKTSGVGKSAMVLNPLDEIVFECHLVRGRPDLSKIDPRFLNLYLNALFARHYLVARANFVTMATIDQIKFKDLSICVPDLEKQQQIADYLDTETQKIDDMIKTVKQAIATLQEYRTALITAAVTGKIDVRGFKSANPLEG